MYGDLNMDENNKEYMVYLYRNTKNGKLYIGRTGNLNKRCGCSGDYYFGSKRFYPAIQKYGWESFEQIILKRNLSYEESVYWERFYIRFFDTVDERYGYNYAEGSALEGIKNGFYGKYHSVDSIRVMSVKKTGGNNPKAKPVECINTGEIFPSAKEASDWCGASRQHINRVCRGERYHTGKHPITGELLKWRYIDDKD